jgi:hypothetical protein
MSATIDPSYPIEVRRFLRAADVRALTMKGFQQQAAIIGRVSDEVEKLMSTSALYDQIFVSGDDVRATAKEVATLCRAYGLDGEPFDILTLEPCRIDEEAFCQTIARLLEKLKTTGPAKAAASEESNPGPMAWRDGDKTYQFSQPVLWGLWKVISARPRRFTRDELRDRVLRWRDSLIGDDTIDRTVKELRAFWRGNGRADIADNITTLGGAVGFNVPKT